MPRYYKEKDHLTDSALTWNGFLNNQAVKKHYSPSLQRFIALKDLPVNEAIKIIFPKQELMRKNIFFVFYTNPGICYRFLAVYLNYSDEKIGVKGHFALVF